MAPSRTFLAAATVVLAGCGPSLFVSNGPGHDPQACVEAALRRGADEETATLARAEFELGCRAGDAASCSALGVMYEIGAAGPRSERAARTYYDRACKKGNQRGCVNLGKLDLARGDDAAAHARFREACERGQMEGCASIGRAFARAEGVAKDFILADSMLGRACDAQIAEACFDLAELYRGEAHDDPRRSVELYAKSCAGGHEPACRRIGRPGSSVASR